VAQDELTGRDQPRAGTIGMLARPLGARRVKSAHPRLRYAVLEAEMLLPGELAGQGSSRLLVDDGDAVRPRHLPHPADLDTEVLLSVRCDDEKHIDRCLPWTTDHPARRGAGADIVEERGARCRALAKGLERLEVGAEARREGEHAVTCERQVDPGGAEVVRVTIASAAAQILEQLVDSRHLLGRGDACPHWAHPASPPPALAKREKEQALIVLAEAGQDIPLAAGGVDAVAKRQPPPPLNAGACGRRR